MSPSERIMRAQLERIVVAFEICESGRGRFSCVDAHDCRCPKARASRAADWRGEWVCQCGAEELDAALDGARSLMEGV